MCATPTAVLSPRLLLHGILGLLHFLLEFQFPVFTIAIRDAFRPEVMDAEKDGEDFPNVDENISVYHSRLFDICGFSCKKR